MNIFQDKIFNVPIFRILIIINNFFMGMDTITFSKEDIPIFAVSVYSKIKVT